MHVLAGRPLGASEVEQIMGFPKGHTRYFIHAKNSEPARRKMLGNSFQVDNIVYLLSPLKVGQCTLPNAELCALWFGAAAGPTAAPRHALLAAPLCTARDQFVSCDPV